MAEWLIHRSEVQICIGFQLWIGRDIKSCSWLPKPCWALRKVTCALCKLMCKPLSVGSTRSLRSADRCDHLLWAHTSLFHPSALSVVGPALLNDIPRSHRSLILQGISPTCNSLRCLETFLFSRLSRWEHQSSEESLLRGALQMPVFRIT